MGNTNWPPLSENPHLEPRFPPPFVRTDTSNLFNRSESGFGIASPPFVRTATSNLFNRNGVWVIQTNPP